MRGEKERQRTEGRRVGETRDGRERARERERERERCNEARLQG